MHIAIIGAGLAGLTAAYELHKTPGAEIDVFEASDRIGGKLHTVPFSSGPTDMGAEAFIPTANTTALINELGLDSSIVKPSGMRSQLYVNGHLHPIPRAGVMGIPTSSAGLEAILSEQALKLIDANSPISWQPGSDRSLGELVRSAYGDEVVDVLLSTLLGGVYSATADDLGVRATLPELADALDTLSVEGETLTLRDAVELVAQRRKEAGRAPMFGFHTFRGGYAELYEALAEKSEARIHLDCFISAISRNGDSYEINRKTYDKVIIALPAPTAAALLSQIAPDASTQLRSIKLASSAVVGLKFDEEATLPDVSGVLVAVGEPNITAKAFTFCSKKWPHLKERGGELVRVSFGRLGDDAISRTEEDELVDTALDDLHTITGFDGRAAGPSEIYLQRWFGGLPAYSPGHSDTVAAVRAEIAAIPGLEITGSWAGGVGVPAVIADAQAAAARLLS